MLTYCFRKMLHFFIYLVMVTTMVDMVTGTTESLIINGSPQLGYYVQLGLGNPYQLVNQYPHYYDNNIVILLMCSH